MFFPQHNSTYKSWIKAISITKEINSCSWPLLVLKVNAFKVQSFNRIWLFSSLDLNSPYLVYALFLKKLFIFVGKPPPLYDSKFSPKTEKPKMFLCAWHTLIHPWHDIRLEFAVKVNKQFLKKIYVVLLLFFVCVTNLSLYWKKVVVGMGCVYAVTYHFIWECNEPMQ